MMDSLEAYHCVKINMTTNSPSTRYPSIVDLTECDKEPIHIIGHIQNHGALIACRSDNKIVNYASTNTNRLLGSDAQEVLGKTIYSIFDKDFIDYLFELLDKRKVAYKDTVINDQKVTAIAHKSDDVYIFEFELNNIEIEPFQYQMQLIETASEINNLKGTLEKCDFSASLIKKSLGYDRVMIYKFDRNWNGNIISEQKENHLESWLGLRFPASDIPQQARQLFLKQGARILENVESESVPISAFEATTLPLDLSNSELRAVSPIHIEYLKNMGVSATLTVAIVQDNQLWGLIACHNYSPKYINYYQRLSCKFLAQMLATNLNLNNTNEVLDKLNESAFLKSALINQIEAEGDIIKGLLAFDLSINDLTNSFGAAVYIDGVLEQIGQCPSEQETLDLVENIKNHTTEKQYFTNCLTSDFQDAESYMAVASGVLCAFISADRANALLWFKPELIQTVTWAGNPDKSIGITSDHRLSPRKSFEKWSVEQRGTSEIWEDYEISDGLSLQESIQDITLAKLDEVKELNRRLSMAYQELESFSYSISHDLRAPLRGIDGFAHILKEDYYNQLDDFGRSSVDTIIASISKMNLLIDDILEYSHLGNNSLNFNDFSMKTLVEEIYSDLKLHYSHVKVTIDQNLPWVSADKTIVHLLVLNLLENAMKYSATVDEPQVSIGFRDNGIFYVEDNGVGFDMKHEKRIFGVFDRLVGEEYAGSGIGLAIAKRVVDKHHGKIWAESKPRKGSIFYFKLTSDE